MLLGSGHVAICDSEVAVGSGTQISPSHFLTNIACFSESFMANAHLMTLTSMETGLLTPFHDGVR